MSSYDSVNKVWKGPKFPYPYAKDVYFGEELLKVLCKSPESIMFINHEENYSMTRGEARELSINVARNLIKLGIKPDDVVGVICRNSKYVPVVLYGCIIVGAPINPLDVSFGKDDIKHMFKLTKPKIVFCDHDMYQVTKEVLNEMHNDAKVFTLLGEVPDVAFVEEIAKYSGDDSTFIPPKFSKPVDQKILAIISTSGTTGPPKGFCVSHACLFFHAISPVNPVPYSILYFSSVCWMSGFLASVCNVAFRPTETKVQTLKPFSVETLVNLVEKYKINITFLVPSHLYIFLQSQTSDKVDFSTMGMIISGGSKISTELLKLFRQKFPSTLLVIAYAMTEGFGTMKKPGKVYKNETSSGSVTQNTVIKIIDDDGNKLGVGEEGEIMLKSSIPFLGYYNNPEATKNALDSEGFYRTGDIGFFDEEESLSVVDRKKDILKYKMFHVNPSEIEELILAIDGVVQVAVIGIPDPEVQYLAKAVVTRKEGFGSLTEQDIVDYVSERLPSYKHLHGGVVFIESIPMTASGKVRKRDLVEKFGKNDLNH